MAVRESRCRGDRRCRDRRARELLPRLPQVPEPVSTPTSTSLPKLLAHNLDAVVALVALPVFVLAGWPLAGWFCATALWALNRYLQARIERRAADMTALRGVGVMGASMLLRPWIGMLILFLVTRHDTTLAVSSVLLFMVLVTLDIRSRSSPTPLTPRTSSCRWGGTSTRESSTCGCRPRWRAWCRC